MQGLLGILWFFLDQLSTALRKTAASDNLMENT
jgi:hypothetical protein